MAKQQSELEKFWNRKGMVNLGHEPMTEETAAKINQLMDDIEAGKIKPMNKLPKALREQEKK